jgi:peptidoglycan/LPS O-acetylase OafA/YrhL
MDKILGFKLRNSEISAPLRTFYVDMSGSRWSGVLSALTPSFLRTSREGAAKPRLHPTSYLDGLRGVAGFFVWIHHFILFWFPSLSHGYNSGPNTTSIFQLPFRRIVYSGRGMVTIFFVISGYVLSYKSLKQIRKRDFAPLLDTLASATFRRAMRLFLPIAAATMLTMVAHRLGWYIGAPTMPVSQPTFWGQLWDWWQNFIALSNPTQGIDGNAVYADPYGFQLWTIPREFRGSIFTYVTLLGAAKLHQPARLVLLSGFTWYLFWITQWDLGLFLCGTILADIHFMTKEPEWGSVKMSLSKFVPRGILQHKNLLQHALTIVATLVAIHFLTFPDEGSTTSPGYRHMIANTPAQYGGFNLTQRFWLCVGAVLFVAALVFSPLISASDPTPMLQKVFILPFTQYLGNISYALYISHHLCLFTVGIRILNFWKDKTTTDYAFGFIEAIFVNTFMCFWVADLFWRGVDAKSVQVAKWVADKCFIDK